MSTLMKFLRRPEAQAAAGIASRSEFYAQQAAGTFPPPDAYLGPKSPVWSDTTIAEWQRWTLADRPGGTWENRTKAA